MRKNNLSNFKPNNSQYRVVKIIAGCIVAAVVIEVGLVVVFNLFKTPLPNKDLQNSVRKSEVAQIEPDTILDNEYEKNIEKLTTTVPNNQQDVELEAIKAWIVSNNMSLNPDNAVRIQSEYGITTTRDGNQNEVSVPFIVSYWRVDDTYLKVTNQLDEHNVSLLTDTVPGVNDNTNSPNNESVGEIQPVTNPDTGDVLPQEAVEKLDHNLQEWLQEHQELNLDVNDTYLDEYSIQTNDNVITFDVRGANKERALVVIHASYDVATDTTTFNVD